MEEYMKTSEVQQWTNLIRFRSPDNLGAVITQTFILIAAFIAILGFIYVVCTLIVITIHHFLYDRDPNKIPDFVKNSIQFSSEEDDSDDGGGGKNKQNKKLVGKELQKSTRRRTYRKGPTISKEGLILTIVKSSGVNDKPKKRKARNKRSNKKK